VLVGDKRPKTQKGELANFEYKIPIGDLLKLTNNQYDEEDLKSMSLLERVQFLRKFVKKEWEQFLDLDMNLEKKQSF
jgi:hypothetical protein